MLADGLQRYVGESGRGSVLALDVASGRTRRVVDGTAIGLSTSWLYHCDDTNEVRRIRRDGSEDQWLAPAAVLIAPLRGRIRAVDEDGIYLTRQDAPYEIWHFGPEGRETFVGTTSDGDVEVPIAPAARLFVDGPWVYALRQPSGVHGADSLTRVAVGRDEQYVISGTDVGPPRFRDGASTCAHPRWARWPGRWRRRAHRPGHPLNTGALRTPAPARGSGPCNRTRRRNPGCPCSPDARCASPTARCDCRSMFWKGRRIAGWIGCMPAAARRIEGRHPDLEARLIAVAQAVATRRRPRDPEQVVTVVVIDGRIELRRARHAVVGAVGRADAAELRRDARAVRATNHICASVTQSPAPPLESLAPIEPMFEGERL